MGVNSVCSARLEEVFSCADVGFRILSFRILISGGSQIERSLYNLRSINGFKTSLRDSIAFDPAGRVRILSSFKSESYQQ
jgi:hypothetical protein